METEIARMKFHGSGVGNLRISLLKPLIIKIGGRQLNETMPRRRRENRCRSKVRRSRGDREDSPGLEGPCLVNNAAREATRNVGRDRNERTNAASKREHRG